LLLKGLSQQYANAMTTNVMVTSAMNASQFFNPFSPGLSAAQVGWESALMLQMV
jgi:hypothetical protein